MFVGCLAASLTEQLAAISAALGLCDKCINCQAHLLGASRTRWHQQQTGSGTLSFSVMPDSPKWWLIGTIKILTPLLNLFPFCFTADHSSPVGRRLWNMGRLRPVWQSGSGGLSQARTPHFSKSRSCVSLSDRSERGLGNRSEAFTRERSGDTWPFFFFHPRGDGAEIS